MNSSFCNLWLTCKDTVEADAIVTALLDKKLIVCAKQMKVESKFVWKGSVQNDNEVLLLMDSRMDLFDEVETEVAKHHSYETFVLEAVPVNQVSKSAEKWMVSTLKQ